MWEKIEKNINNKDTINKLLLEKYPKIEESGLNMSELIIQILSNLKNSEKTEGNIKTQIQLTVSKAIETIEK